MGLQQKRQIYVADSTWTAFKIHCVTLGTDMSSRIRHLIKQDIASYQPTIPTVPSPIGRRTMRNVVLVDPGTDDDEDEKKDEKAEKGA